MDPQGPTRKTSRTFDRISGEFDLRRKRPWPSLGALGEVRGKRVLDLGAGTGRNSCHLIEKGASLVVAADLSAGMLRVLRGKGWASPELGIVRCDAAHLPFRDSAFDIVAFIAALHHIAGRGREEAMREVWRVTAEGGRALITVWAPEGLPKGARPVASGDESDYYVPWGGEGERYYHIFSPGELRRLVEVSGLTITMLCEERVSKGKLGKNLVALASRQGIPNITGRGRDTFVG